MLSGLVNQHFFDFIFVHWDSAERSEGEGVLALDLARILINIYFSTSGGPLRVFKVQFRSVAF